MSGDREPPREIELPECLTRLEREEAQVLLFRLAVERHKARKCMTQPHPVYPTTDGAA
jgi:hypothetical protein